MASLLAGNASSPGSVPPQRSTDESPAGTAHTRAATFRRRHPIGSTLAAICAAKPVFCRQRLTRIRQVVQLMWKQQTPASAGVVASSPELSLVDKGSEMWRRRELNPGL